MPSARAFDAGATDFSSKPIHPEMLRHRVRFLVRSRRAVEGLRRSEARLSAAQKIAALGSWELDPTSRSIRLSAEAGEILGVRGAALEEDAFLERFSADDRVTLRRVLASARVEKRGFDLDATVESQDGGSKEVQIQAKAIADDPTEGAWMLGTIQDVSERRENERKIRFLAYYDVLTGLPNRAFFHESLLASLARARRQSGQLAVLFVDLDNFKRINDSLGHPAGDRVLQEVGRRLRDAIRLEDGISRFGTEREGSLARLGGDEFTLVLGDLRQPEDAARVATRILTILKPPVALETGEIFVSASIGISVFPRDGMSAEELLRNADTALYHAKESGRNAFHFWNETMNTAAFQRLTMEASLRQAVDRDQFLLHYQPQVRLGNRGIAGFEALLRWQHPEIGMVSPGLFVPIAEETGLIRPIGEWVLRATCLQLRAWQDAGLPETRVAVNLSSRQFGDPDVPRTLEAILRETGARAELLELEVTESAVVKDAARAVSDLEALRALGVRIALDDFGTGYSSLAYLKRLPIDVLKIDRSFVRDVATDPRDAAIVSGIVQLAHALGLEVVAEGVEETDQFVVLTQTGCDVMQGFLFGKPQPAAEAARLLSIPADLATP